MTRAKIIIERFGGVRSMARALGHKNASTVQGWSERNYIPQKHHAQIFAVAKTQDLEIEPTEFLAVPLEAAE